MAPGRSYSNLLTRFLTTLEKLIFPCILTQHPFIHPSDERERDVQVHDGDFVHAGVFLETHLSMDGCSRPPRGCNHLVWMKHPMR